MKGGPGGACYRRIKVNKREGGSKGEAIEGAGKQSTVC